MLSSLGEIRRNDKCLEFSGGKRKLKKEQQLFFRNCHGLEGNQRWWVEEDGSIHHNSGYCLEMLESSVMNEKTLVMAECNKKNILQKWIWNVNEKKL